MRIYRIRRLLTATLVLLVSSVAAVAPVTASAHPRRHHPKHRHGIPQHNGGDHDGDNNGGPSDGDGNV